jgi:hypothetical protein
MSKRSVFTTVTPLPTGIGRETVMETLHNHVEMIDLNPLIEERHPIKPPSDSTPEEFYCLWYSLTDRVSYMPGGLISGKVSYNSCFHDLEEGVQTHCYAPMGLTIKAKWTLGGSLPGEPVAPVELGIGAPLSGLYIREDVDMRCNIMMTAFVKKTLKNAHARLVDRLVTKAQFTGVAHDIEHVSQISVGSRTHFSGSQATTDYSPSDYGESMAGLEDGAVQHNSSRFSNQYGAPQIGPLPSVDFRGSTSPDFRASTNEAVMMASHHPALTVRSPDPPSQNGSYAQQQRAQLPYPETPAGSHQDLRASWQRSPSVPSISLQQTDPTYQPAPPYTEFAQPRHAESPANEERYGAGRRGGQRRSRERLFESIPRVYGAAELAG